MVVLDGWGHSSETAANAIAQAHTPNWDQLWRDCPHSLLSASGEAVGLPDGQMGNSEVGHSTLGAGRVLWQSLARLDRAIAADGLAGNAELSALMQGVRARGGRLHLFGLLSDGGVHSHEQHLYSLLRLAVQAGVEDVLVHAILDGRDVPPRSAAAYIERMEAELKACGYGPVADVSGRYWAMDRDQRWERTARAWELYVRGAAEHRADSAGEALQQAYGRGESDEFVAPALVRDGPGRNGQGRNGEGRNGQVQDGDALLFANFRADRMRQLVSAFCAPADGEAGGLTVDFDRGQVPQLADVLTMTEYQPDLPVRVAFAAEEVGGSLGEVVADLGLGQLRIAETEKFAHVTYFFSCGRNEPFAGERRILVPSPKVATYDLAPAMSAAQITEQLQGEIAAGDWRLAVCNYANGDMVGHTGKMPATVAAVEYLDECLGQLRQAAQRQGAHLWITADHGNCERMQDADNDQAHTAHTLNPVPLVYSGPLDLKLRASGGLADVAPTLLRQMGLEVPAAMTGESLLDS